MPIKFITARHEQGAAFVSSAGGLLGEHEADQETRKTHFAPLKIF